MERRRTSQGIFGTGGGSGGPLVLRSRFEPLQAQEEGESGGHPGFGTLLQAPCWEAWGQETGFGRQSEK
eukprot:6081503-Lingulodinium_polyedra.AAC.1